MLGQVEVLKYGPTGNYPMNHILHTKSLQSLRAKLVLKFVPGIFFGINPLFQQKGIKALTKYLLELVAMTPLYQHLLWLKAGK